MPSRIDHAFFGVLLVAGAVGEGAAGCRGPAREHPTSIEAGRDGRFVSHERKDMLLLATGDLIGASYVEVAMRKYGAAYPFSRIRPLIEEADLAFANLECVISASGSVRSHHQRKINYNATPLVFESLKLSGFDVFSMANNHVFDMGAVGLVGMLELFRESPFVYGGAGRNLAEAAAPGLVRVNGLDVAFLFYHDSSRFAATPSRAGYNGIDIGDFEAVRTILARDLERVPPGVDLTIVSLHWGDNYTTRITPEQRRFAHHAIDNGVDLILGHGAHVFHGIEIYKGQPILYDLGDILINDDDSWDTRSFLFYVSVKAGRIDALRLVPVYIVNGQVRRAEGLMAKRINARFSQLSTRFDLPITREGNTVVVTVP